MTHQELAYIIHNTAITTARDVNSAVILIVDNLKLGCINITQAENLLNMVDNKFKAHMTGV